MESSKEPLTMTDSEKIQLLIFILAFLALAFLDNLHHAREIRLQYLQEDGRETIQQVLEEDEIW